MRRRSGVNGPHQARVVFKGPLTSPIPFLRYTKGRPRLNPEQHKPQREDCSYEYEYQTHRVNLPLASALVLGSTQLLAQTGITKFGTIALISNTTGNYNSAFGDSALRFNTIGYYNTASGNFSLSANITGTNNTANGNFALDANTTGGYNTALGNQSLQFNTIGGGNMGIGNGALYANTTGNRNMGIGEIAGFSNSTGSDNVFIGRSAGFYETGSNKLYITNNTVTPLLYGVFSATAANNKLGIGTSTVAVGDAINVWNGARLTVGGVWTNGSSRELKDNIKPLTAKDADAALAALSPVRYVYKNSRDEEYVGFIAEDVPDLVAMNDRKSLSPMDIVAVLTTVTKEQKAKMNEQQVKMAQKDGEIAELKDRMLKMEQANEERMQQMEMALAEVQRHQTGEVQVSSAN